MAHRFIAGVIAAWALSPGETEDAAGIELGTQLDRKERRDRKGVGNFVFFAFSAVDQSCTNDTR